MQRNKNFPCASFFSDKKSCSIKYFLLYEEYISLQYIYSGHARTSSMYFECSTELGRVQYQWYQFYAKRSFKRWSFLPKLEILFAGRVFLLVIGYLPWDSVFLLLLILVSQKLIIKNFWPIRKLSKLDNRCFYIINWFVCSYAPSGAVKRF